MRAPSSAHKLHPPRRLAPTFNAKTSLDGTNQGLEGNRVDAAAWWSRARATEGGGHAVAGSMTPASRVEVFRVSSSAVTTTPRASRRSGGGGRPAGGARVVDEVGRCEDEHLAHQVGILLVDAQGQPDAGGAVEDGSSAPGPASRRSASRPAACRAPRRPGPGRIRPVGSVAALPWR